ncbi:MAG: hypothetical protein M1832_005549 [Thelocarpon impressellum]|nr:MAG: hypothetical protein M1832_005549 [Thelocarpon impressellum]
MSAPYVAPTVLVSHLPRATSFYLSALAPLGYGYLGRGRGGSGSGSGGDGAGIALGLACGDSSSGGDSGGGGVVDFFLAEGVVDGQLTRHLTFRAPSARALRAFHAAALRAGARSRRAPGPGCSAGGCATVVDPDGNTLDASYSPGEASTVVMPATGSARDVKAERETERAGSAILSWQEDVARSTAPAAQAPPPEPLAQLVIPAAEMGNTTGVYAGKALLGTLLGAAGGAAVAYAMMRAEDAALPAREECGAPIVMVDRTVPAPSVRAPSRVSRAERVDRGVDARTAVSRRGETQTAAATGNGQVIGTLISSLVPAAATALQLLEPAPMSAPHFLPPSVARSGTTTVKPPPPPAPPTAVTREESYVSARAVPLPSSRASHAGMSARSGVAHTVVPSDSISNVPSPSPAPSSHSKTRHSKGGRSTASSSKRTVIRAAPATGEGSSKASKRDRESQSLVVRGSRMSHGALSPLRSVMQGGW